MRYLHPVTCELPDLRGDTKKVRQDCFQPFGVPGLRRHATGKMDLCPIRYRIPILKSRGANTKKTSKIIGITSVVRAIKINALLIARPSTIKERQHSMMENVHEPNQRRIMGISQAITCEIGQLLRKRAVWPEHAQEVDVHPNDWANSFDAFNT